MINSYMTDTVTLNQFLGNDTYGTPVSPRDVTVRCRLSYGAFQVRDMSGEVVVSNVMIRMAPRTVVMSGIGTDRETNTIAYEDTVTFDGRVHPIASIFKKGDFSTRFLEVYVK